MLRKLLPHVAIIISFMYFVFFFIDRVNSAMAFINNDITKVLIFILCVLSLVEAVMIIRDDRRKTRLREKKRQKQAAKTPPRRSATKRTA